MCLKVLGVLSFFFSVFLSLPPLVFSIIYKAVISIVCFVIFLWGIVVISVHWLVILGILRYLVAVGACT